MSLALQSGVISTGPRGKSPRTFLYFHVFLLGFHVLGLCLMVARWQCLNQSFSQFLSLFSPSIFEDHYEPVGFYVSDIFQPAADVLLLTL